MISCLRPTKCAAKRYTKVRYWHKADMTTDCAMSASLTALGNHSRFLRNDHQAWHGHASLVADRLLFELQHHKTGSFDRRAYITSTMRVAPAIAHNKTV